MSNVTLVQDLYAAFGRGDIDEVLAMCDGQIAWHEAEGNPYQPSGKPFVGPDDILQNLFARLGADWSQFSVHPQRFHEAGDTVVVEARYTGTHARTGKTLDAQVCHVWQYRAGKLIRFQQFVDTAQLQRVMAGD